MVKAKAGKRLPDPSRNARDQHDDGVRVKSRPAAEDLLTPVRMASRPLFPPCSRRSLLMTMASS